MTHAEAVLDGVELPTSVTDLDTLQESAVWVGDRETQHLERCCRLCGRVVSELRTGLTDVNLGRGSVRVPCRSSSSVRLPACLRVRLLRLHATAAALTCARRDAALRGILTEMTSRILRTVETSG